ncbi:Nucleotide Sugar TransPorter family [Caenorhabditis elegans]|uniref:Nucleotide Sugar TransPorter family n=1 Tax=Caenorhabditis elegans TaxID=6239 RepID=O17106_CAEEL|nr:Nucleotide Sugar TransPorter family [Caenorhabditis elegans]CCD64474.3 Nucleotide Sugar TransPorter family [Caenorhabditis elegans]|eukprot:NP_503252.3 Nucleotide Sugar TransPorter family [Caenorhabditis elegans]
MIRSEVKQQTVGIEIARENDSSSRPIIRVLFSVQLLSMIAVTTHHTAMPFLVKIANKSHFLPTTSVFMMEILKLSFCLIIVLIETRSIRKTAKKLHKNIWQNWWETMKVSVPALVYAVQNNLYYVALANIDATTYSVTLQLRILTTAILSVVLLSKKLSGYQWMAQGMALIGVIVVQLDNSNSRREIAGNFWLGLASVLGMCWTSAFAGVYFEKMLKNSSADVWIQNIRLSILTLLFAGITMLSKDGDAIITGNIFHGWTWIVWLVTIGNSIGGLCISLVMKYADNVMKTYCQSLAIGFTSIVSICLGDRLLSLYLGYGVFLVTSSVVVYSLYPATQPTTPNYKPLKQDITEDTDE